MQKDRSKIAIILTAILSISACGGSTSNSNTPSGDVSRLGSTVPRLFNPAGTAAEIAEDFRKSVDENREYINFDISAYEVKTATGDLLFNLNISPSSKGNNILVTLSKTENENKPLTKQFDLSIDKTNDKNGVASIDLLSEEGEIVGYGLIFPYGSLVEGYNPDGEVPNDESTTYADIEFVQGHVFRLSVNAQFPKKISFGGFKTKSRGYISPDQGEMTLTNEDALQFTLDLEYRGYNQNSGLHEFRPKISKLSTTLFDSVIHTDKFILYSIDDEDRKNPLDFITFRPDKLVAFTINGGEPQENHHVINDNTWTVTSKFDSFLFGPDVNNLYIAGYYVFAVNKVTVPYGPPVTGPENDTDEYVGLYVLPKL